jgi:hypothetical protein
MPEGFQSIIVQAVHEYIVVSIGGLLALHPGVRYNAS